MLKNCARWTTMSAIVRLFGLTVMLVVCGAAPVWAQTQTNLEKGFKPYGSYDGTHLDSINLMNGNLTLHAPLLPDYPQRGKFSLQDILLFNSKTWQVNCWFDRNDPTSYQCQWFGGGTGVTLQRSVDMSLQRMDESYNSGTGIQDFTSLNYTLITPDGASHQLVVLEYGTPHQYETASPQEMETMDTTGYHVTMSGTDSNGVPNIATITDRKGNQFVANFQPFGGGGGLCPSLSTLPTNNLPPLTNKFTGEIYYPMRDDAPDGRPRLPADPRGVQGYRQQWQLHEPQGSGGCCGRWGRYAGPSAAAGNRRPGA